MHLNQFINVCDIISEVKGQNATWTQEASEASGRSQVLDVGQTWWSLHHQVQIRTPQAVRLSARHSVHQVASGVSFETLFEWIFHGWSRRLTI